MAWAAKLGYLDHERLPRRAGEHPRHGAGPAAGRLYGCGLLQLISPTQDCRRAPSGPQALYQRRELGAQPDQDPGHFPNIRAAITMTTAASCSHPLPSRWAAPPASVTTKITASSLHSAVLHDQQSLAGRAGAWKSYHAGRAAHRLDLQRQRYVATRSAAMPGSTIPMSTGTTVVLGSEHLHTQASDSQLAQRCVAIWFCRRTASAALSAPGTTTARRSPTSTTGTPRSDGRGDVQSDQPAAVRLAGLSGRFHLVVHRGTDGRLRQGLCVPARAGWPGLALTTSPDAYRRRYQQRQ